MQTLENFFLNIGLSWTFSKIVTYLVCLLIGFIIMRIFLKYAKKVQRTIRLIIAAVLFVLPFIIGFIISPIYEGDFSIGGKQLSGLENPDLKSNGLTVVTIPNCPYCIGSIAKLKKIKERYPQIPIKYVVCAKSEEDIAHLVNMIDGKFELVLAKDAQNLANIVGGTFPTFVMVEKNRASHIWSNDDFGPRAIDLIENTFAKEPYRKRVEKEEKLEEREAEKNEKEKSDSLKK